ncbi:dethiobiotin synthase [Aneurinibacillus aneurinilyticus]|jgi:dethiobiotin synthetase|uniref:ATP-dependent dethiobiotin synthetase BioD n=2 Tax=Aneurinibacillus aneurinilyticus TaxID=1391 RepID=A0A848CUP8_ANEAE|nr:dethiobiotin synthase [Aneurinibacillus aneurinilyticus]ERI08290.1 dethiobiotin synthase [Aneurinibacillus aneurinilyticus ATCC 12856]MED0669796.1 dethiobiotin synthase [Aneurinibacillus aneurinilyticus]MED0705705.1 dethiobiotin synthase [Aneurinibacillus aneurinilyticus]MED0725826.1 dethiobiotin synthase [Aneurinibacillus aneurinilyticus]MED0732173.1 dethiobiotin synthase [Aneurinibacillus aneurinilyticus]
MKQGHALFVTGTDTGIGKTMITACLTALLARCEYDAVPYKPIQSGGIRMGDTLIAEDVAFYQSIHPLPYGQDELCTYCMEPAVSPHLAAQQTKVFIDPDCIARQLQILRKNHDFVVVEGAGGLAVPLYESEQGIYMTDDLITHLHLPLLLVTHPGLGTINHTVLTVKYAQAHGIPILGFIVNYMPQQPNSMERDNVRMISELTGLPVLGSFPQITDTAPEALRMQLDELRTHINLALLLERLEQAEAELLQIKRMEE